MFVDGLGGIKAPCYQMYMGPSSWQAFQGNPDALGLGQGNDKPFVYSLVSGQRFLPSIEDPGENVPVWETFRKHDLPLDCAALFSKALLWLSDKMLHTLHPMLMLFCTFSPQWEDNDAL